MTVRTTVTTTSQRVGKDVESVATEKSNSRNQSLADQYK